jgi:hypothetical protein
MHSAPRHYESIGPLPGAGLPHDRLARMAARRVFVDLKDRFVQAAAALEGANAAWLRAQIRGAEQPEDLMLLRGHLFAALAGTDERRRETRRTLRRCIDSLFPDSAPRSGFASF